MTGNKEDYIKAIYELGGNKTIVSNKDIAKILGVSAPSVSEMINKLVKDGYVDSIAYRGVKLTDLGLDLAIKIRKRHLLWEVFLVEKLGYDWADVHEEAEILEHITSPKLEKALDKYLDYPKYCPHGSAIISSKEEDREYNTLGGLEANKKYRIVRIDDARNSLDYIQKIGLKIGTIISLKARDQLDSSSIIILNEDRQMSVGREYINKIYVEEI